LSFFVSDENETEYKKTLFKQYLKLMEFHFTWNEVRNIPIQDIRLIFESLQEMQEKNKPAPKGTPMKKEIRSIGDVLPMKPAG